MAPCVVPVVAGAAASLETCAGMVDDVVQQARTGNLGHSASPGQATVTNIGVFGGRYSQPILNAGQPIILGLGSVERRLVPHEGGLGVRALQPVSLAYDRNRVDEVTASRMLSDLRVARRGRLVASLSWSKRCLRPSTDPHRAGSARSKIQSARAARCSHRRRRSSANTATRALGSRASPKRRASRIS